MTALTTEQVIADMRGWTDLKAYFEGIRGDIDTRLNTAEERVGDARRSFFIDQANGDDANDGATDAAPLASFEEAISRSVFGGLLGISLMSDYTLSTQPVFRCGSVSITGYNDAIRNIYFADRVDDVKTASPRFQSSWNSTDFFLNRIRLHSRVMAPHITSKCMFSSTGLRIVTMYNSEIQAAAGDDLALLSGDGHGIGIGLTNVTASAEMAGLWIDGVAAGTTATSISRLAYSTLATL